MTPSDPPTPRARRFDARYALWGATALLLVVLPAFGGFVGIGWESAQWAGLAAAIACIILCGSPLRPRDSQPPTLLSLRLHALIGWAALIAVVVHIGGLLLADRTVIEYLKPTAPLYQFAGIAALLVLLVLVPVSVAGARRRLWKSHRGFQAAHVVLACALCALIAVHVVVTARYAGGHARRAWFVAAAIGAILLLLRARRPSVGRSIAEPSEPAAPNAAAAPEHIARDPTAGDPTASDPTASDRTARDPTARDPTARDPTARDPTARDPTARDPTARDPTARDPTARDPTARDPTARDPTARDPTARDPTARDPTARDPTARDPTARDPTARDPTARESAARDPAARDPTARGGAAAPRRQFVFGRHSTLVVGAVAVSAAIMAGLYPDAVGAALREPLMRRTSALPLDFPHAKHGAVNCLTCHHNYADSTGSALCIECHRSMRADLKQGVEARFHGFCFECHRHPAATFARHGPVSGCVACHRAVVTEQ